MPQKNRSTNRLFILLRVLLFCLCCAIILIIGSTLIKGFSKEWNDLILGIFATMAIFAITLLFASWEKIKPEAIGIVARQGSLRKGLIGFFIGILLSISHVLAVALFGHVSVDLMPVFPIATALFSLLLYFVLAIREELAFRGYPLRMLNYSFGSFKAQVIVALIFALEHWAGGYSWIQAFFGSTVGGVLFGIAALKTKGIAMPIGMHAAWNFGQWIFGFKNEPGIFYVTIENGFEKYTEVTTMFCYLIIMLLAIFYFYYRKTPVPDS